ncbi:MAG: hypothetical protein RL691_69 [Actinomycetota bacterium]
MSTTTANTLRLHRVTHTRVVCLQAQRLGIRFGTSWFTQFCTTWGDTASTVTKCLLLGSLTGYRKPLTPRGFNGKRQNTGGVRALGPDAHGNDERAYRYV